jgi:hypothetical protein
MAKRYTDSEKWQDSWFTDLTNDQKIIWIYLLDHCDNAGLWKINMKNLNFFCSTNISVEELLSLFNKRLTQISTDVCLINKFCIYQYGPDFLTSKNKAVESAINKLILSGIVQECKGIYTLSIPYQYTIDTPKEKEEEKVIDKVEDKFKLKEQIEEQLKNKVKNKFEYKTKAQRDNMTQEELDQYWMQLSIHENNK